MIHPNLRLPERLPEGYPYQLVGNAQQSWQYINRIYVIYEKDEETGEPLKDDDGNYIIKELRKITSKANEILTVDGVPTTDINAPFDQKTGTTAAMAFLMDENGSVMTVYCCDLGVSSYHGDWYAIENLEDADYYASEEAEKHVRNIVTNGYWGTEEGKGSLAQIKEKMKNALAEGEIDSEIEITYQNAKGENVTETITLTDEIIDAMTSGEALDMTQAAIWAYSNGAQGVQDGRDGYVVGNVVYGDTYRGRQKTGSDDPAGMARMTAMYNWLVELDEDLTSTTVINEDHFVKDLTLTVGDKEEDKGGDSDIYNADLNFKMEFKPSEINDDLLLHITYTDANGEEQKVIKRIAGSAENDDLGVQYLRPNDDGVYKIEGLKLSENEAFDFELRLEGKQYLDDGVYLFVAEKDNRTHQTLVGMTQGTHTVDVSAKVSIEFNVDETNRYSSERRWSRTWDPNYEIPEENPPLNEEPEPTENIPEEDPPLEEIPEEDPPLEDIFEEEVPLANVPHTGDNSVIFVILAVASAMGLAILAFPRKKNA